MLAAVAAMGPTTRFRELPEGEAGVFMEASLIGPKGEARQATAQQAAASPLEAMLNDLAAPSEAAGPGAGPATGSATALSDLLGPASPREASGGGKPGIAGTSGGSGDAKPGFDYGAQASVGRRRAGTGAGQVGPCWGRPERPVPVVMAILLDQDGALVGRPRIVRSGERPGDPRAAEYERTAMRAMAGCAPFSLAPPGVYEAYRIDFSREKGGLIRLGPMAAP